MRHLFIVNPAAGKRGTTARLEAQLGKLSFPHKVVYTEREGDAQRFAQEAVQAGEPVRIYACGGGGARRSEARGGRRSSGEARAGAAGHGRSCGRRRWPSGRLLSAVAGAGTGCGGSGHAGEELRWRWLRPWW